MARRLPAAAAAALALATSACVYLPSEEPGAAGPRPAATAVLSSCADQEATGTVTVSGAPREVRLEVHWHTFTGQDATARTTVAATDRPSPWSAHPDPPLTGASRCDVVVLGDS